jgi:hypothetical protein
MNRWHRKHRQFIKCFDIRLKTIVLELYRGIRSQVNFASFFLLNASKLELMTFAVENRADNDAFFAEQYRVLQMEKRASRSARLHFRTERCNRAVHVIHVRDLAVANPFECRCWHWIWRLANKNIVCSGLFIWMSKMQKPQQIVKFSAVIIYYTVNGV